MFDKYFTGYETLWKAIIRPPRENYSIKDLGSIYCIKDQEILKLEKLL